MGLTFLDQLLGTVGAVKEELHDSGQERKLDVCGFVEEGIKEGGEQLVRIINAVCVVTNNPDHGGFCVGLVQGVEVLAKSSNDGLISVWILPEDVLCTEKKKRKEKRGVQEGGHYKKKKRRRRALPTLMTTMASWTT